MNPTYAMIEQLIDSPGSSGQFDGKDYTLFLSKKISTDVTWTTIGQVDILHDRYTAFGIVFKDLSSTTICLGSIEPSELMIKEYILGYLEVRLHNEDTNYIQKTVVCRSLDQIDITNFDKECSELVEAGWKTINLLNVDGKLARIFEFGEQK